MYDSQEHAGLEGYAYAKMGDRERAENIIRGMRDQQFPQPYWIARMYAALGDQDKVFEWLDKAVEDRCEGLVKPDYGCGGLWLDEAWDGLRSDPRFVKIQEATGLRWPKQPAQRPLEFGADHGCPVLFSGRPECVRSVSGGGYAPAAEDGCAAVQGLTSHASAASV